MIQPAEQHPIERDRDALLRVLLVGAGHAHLHLIGRARSLAKSGVALHLVSPATFSYSGLATAALSGALKSSQGQVGVAALAAAYSVQHDPTTVRAVDLHGRQAQLDAGDPVDFDVISFNVGSQISDPHGLCAAPGVWPVKPLARLLALRAEVEAKVAVSRRCPSLVVAGGGQTAFEVAAALCGLCERLGVRPDITLVGVSFASHWAPSRAAERLQARLQRRGVELLAGEVVARAAGTCQLPSGLSLPCEALVLATGLIGADLLQTLDLRLDADGRLLVSRHLQALDQPNVFAVGDCSVLDDAPRPCVGVFGVRAAPILARNLVALAHGRPLTAYRPQRRWLSIMDLGDGTGLALHGRIWWLGAAALWLKRRLDLGFIQRTRQGR